MRNRISLRHLSTILRQRAQIWQINEKVRQNATGFVGLRDFSLKKDGTISLQAIANEPAITLYALDHHRRVAIFVETDADLDLFTHPFLYQAQYEHAHSVITMPYALFHKLAAMMPHQPRPIVFIHSVGRCGSTLLSNVFNNLHQVVSLSEPEAFTEIVRHQRPDRGNQNEMKALLQAILRVQCRPTTRMEPEIYAIKFRSFSTMIVDLLHQVAPEAKQVFLYRNAADRARSAARAFKIIEAGEESMSAETLKKRSQFVPLLRRPEYSQRALAGELSWVEFSMLAWLSGMEQMLRVQEAGLPIIPIRYEDMIAAPQEIISQLFAHCGLPQSDVSIGIAAFARDSQKGSALAQEKLIVDEKNQFTSQHIAQLQSLLDQHPRIQDADFRLPQTLSPKVKE